MSQRKRFRKGRAGAAHSRGQNAAEVFEQALHGEECNSPKSFDPLTDRKTLQLCRQIQRVLSLALAGECADDLLREVFVDGVDPTGGAGHLLVRIIVPRNLPALDVLARLNQRTGKLRALVAASICRKRAPMLSYVAVPSSEGSLS